MSSKLRIKMVGIEVEYEGGDDFIKADLMPLLNALQEMQFEPSSDDTAHEDADEAKSKTRKRKSDGKHSTSSIAHAINATTGPDLVKAAVACLTFAHFKDTVSRKEILNEMHTAKHYYKNTYTKNLSSSLQSLVGSNVLNPIGSDTYSLSKTAREALEKKLAE